MFIATENGHLFAISFGEGRRSLLAVGGWAGSWEVWADTLTILSRSNVSADDHAATAVRQTVWPSLT